jgi:hypothetical protein
VVSRSWSRRCSRLPPSSMCRRNSAGRLSMPNFKRFVNRFRTD